MKRKLIEVALPLEAISEEASRRKKKAPAGYPTTLHRWWAQRPLAACRAVLFASLVDDPSSHPEQFPTESDQEVERKRLFGLIEDLVRWENTNDERLLSQARAEILRSTDGTPPAILDPFCGGGSIPLEAQRLGLTAHASDLNPVAVLITKALVEIPPRFAGKAPVNQEARGRLANGGSWHGAQGLAEDIQHYGEWLRREAEARIGHIYPHAKLPDGSEVTPVAWIWARTVRCPNPACGAQMPLARSFALATRKGREAWIEPLIDPVDKSIKFSVRGGVGTPPPGSVDRRGAACIVCSEPVGFEYIRSEGRAGRMGARLMAVVGDGGRSRMYIAPSPADEEAAGIDTPEDVPSTDLPEQALGFRVQAYGMTKHTDLFTPRQLLALATLGDLVEAARERVLEDAKEAGLGDLVDAGETGQAQAYADAVATYLALALSRLADYGCTLSTWRAKDAAMRSVFGRQAIPMVWDYAEGNPFGRSSSGFVECVSVVAKCLEWLPVRVEPFSGDVSQLDASESSLGPGSLCSDPPYYDNIGYADLSDFFYVWLRRSIGGIYPDLFSTLVTPKTQEIIASPFRHDGRRKDADKFFETALRRSFTALSASQSPDIPSTLFYAFKGDSDEPTSPEAVAAGWETMLQALISSGLMIVATWPMRTEGSNRQVGRGTNALASSIVLVCRPRAVDAPVATRRELLNALEEELPPALRLLQHGNIAPVDLAQASIGPGMAVFSRFAKVVEASGDAMSVRTALGLINQVLDAVLTEQESEFDPATRFAIAWFEGHGLDKGAYGEAQVLARAKGTTPEAIEREGFLEARSGEVWLLHWRDLADGWNPAAEQRLTSWEATHHLIRAHQEAEGGSEAAAADLLRRMRGYGEIARELAYRLYVTSERKGWVDLARSYNALVVAWPEISRLADAQLRGPEQVTLGG